MLYTSHNYKVITYNVAPEKIISYNTLKKSGVAITSTHTEKKKTLHMWFTRCNESLYSNGRCLRQICIPNIKSMKYEPVILHCLLNF